MDTLASLIETVGALPEVAAAGIVSPGMLVGLGTADLAITDGGACSQGGLAHLYQPVSTTYHLVSPDTFQAVAVPVLRGRDFSPRDGPAATPPAAALRSFEAMSETPPGG